jgi:actin-related protein
MQMIGENYEEGVLRKSKANIVRNIVEKEDGVSYRTVMRYQKLLKDGNTEEKERIPYSIPFEFD